MIVESLSHYLTFVVKEADQIEIEICSLLQTWIVSILEAQL